MKTMDTNSKFFMIYCMKTFMIQGIYIIIIGFHKISHDTGFPVLVYVYTPNRGRYINYINGDDVEQMMYQGCS